MKLFFIKSSLDRSKMAPPHPPTLRRLLDRGRGVSFDSTLSSEESSHPHTHTHHKKALKYKKRSNANMELREMYDE